MARDPLDLVYHGLETFIKSKLGSSFQVWAEWPSKEHIELSMPCIAVSLIGESSTRKVSEGLTHKEVNNLNGTMTVYNELLRTKFLIQVSIFSKTKLERRTLGSTLIEEIVKAKGFVASDNEFCRMDYIKKVDDVGEPDFYSRHIEIEVTNRLLTSQDVNIVNTTGVNSTI